MPDCVASSLARHVYEISRLALGDQDGAVAVLRVFMDESGIHDGSPIVTVAGYIGRPADWRAWTKEWVRTLRPTKIYHATDAQNLTGEFGDWTSEEVAELAKKLLPIIASGNAHNIAGVVVGIDLRVFEAAMKGHDDLRAIFGTPYVACVQWVMQIFLNLANQTGNSERIAFVHENNSYHGQVYEAFNWIKANSNRGNNVISLTFGGKKDYPPLQAADILAYESNKRLRNLSSPPRRPWEALGGNVFLTHYGDENMDYLIATLEKIKVRTGRAVRPDVRLDIGVSDFFAVVVGVRKYRLHGRSPLPANTISGRWVSQVKHCRSWLVCS
jgi:hypothetical protein